MNKIRDGHIFWLLVFLMVVRVFVGGKWFANIVIAGMLVALLDLINKLFRSNQEIVNNRQKIKYGIWIVILNFSFWVGCVLILLNIILEIPILCDITFLDEITLLTLVLTLSQKMILEKINEMIRK